MAILTERDRGIKRQEEQNRIEKSKYSRKYKQLDTLRVLRYLLSKNKHKKTIARFRCDNEEKANIF